MTKEGYQQAAFVDTQAGLGWKQAIDVARLAHLGGLIAAAPRVKSMFKACEVAGLLSAAPFEDRLSIRMEAAKRSYLDTLGEVEQIVAEDLITRAHHAAEDSWRHAVNRDNPEPDAPRVQRVGQEDEDDSTLCGRSQSRRLSSPQLQRGFCILADRTKSGVWTQH